MENKIDPTVQILLDELAERSYLVRQKEIVNLLKPNNDMAIPLLIERLKDQNDNYYIADNALEVLALSSDYRGILPVIRHIEIETGWTGHIFDYIRQGLKEKDGDMRTKVNEQLIKYLEEGPKTSTPKPFDPVASENQFNDVLGALLKLTGVTEPDEETQQLAREAKEKWVQPPNLAELEKNKIPEYQNIIVEVIDTLSEFDGLGDIQLETLLSNYIKKYGFDSIASQHALTTLSKIKPLLAVSHLNELSASSPLQQDNTIKRIVRHNSGGDIAFHEFTICAREPDAEKWKERPYYFRYEQGLVFFLARGEESYKWFVGQAPNNDKAIQLAIEYLAHWIQNIDSLDVKQTQTGKYSRIHVADRYSECIHLIQQYINFEKWGFEQTQVSQKYEYPHERPQIIYDSEWCRVKFLYRSYGEMYDQSDVLSILYGRLHAADMADSILWNGELHHCWHHISLALCFLDGMSTEEAAKALWNHPIIAGYKKSKEMQNISQPSKESEMHAIIWEKYGYRLFELFDLRRPDLWEKYSVFIKQVYDIRGFKHYGYGVPHEKIC